MPVYPKELKKRAKVNELMDWFNTGFYRDYAYNVVYPQIYPHHKRPTTRSRRARIEWGKELTKKWLKVLNDHWLGKGNKFLAGNQITIADFFGAALLTCGHVTRDEFKDYPNIDRWLKEVEKLPSWAKVNEALDGFRDYVKDQHFVNVHAERDDALELTPLPPCGEGFSSWPAKPRLEEKGEGYGHCRAPLADGRRRPSSLGVRPVDQLRLVVAARQAAERHELDLGRHQQRRRGSRLPDALGEIAGVGLRRSPRSTSTLQRRILAEALRRGRTEMTPLTSGANRADDIAERRREDIDAAHDQHVVGAADAADARRRAAAGAGARSRRGHDRGCGSGEAAPPRGGDACRRARPRRRPRSAPARRSSGSISSKWTKPRPLKCMPCCASHSPQSEAAMSPMPIASVTFAPHALSSVRRIAGSPPPGSPATSRRSDARRRADRCRARAPTRRDAAHRTASAPSASGLSSRTAVISRSVLPLPIGMWQRPSTWKASSATPATNGPAL